MIIFFLIGIIRIGLITIKFGGLIRKSFYRGFFLAIVERTGRSRSTSNRSTSNRSRSRSRSTGRSTGNRSTDRSTGRSTGKSRSNGAPPKQGTQQVFGDQDLAQRAVGSEQRGRGLRQRFGQRFGFHGGGLALLREVGFQGGQRRLLVRRRDVHGDIVRLHRLLQVQVRGIRTHGNHAARVPGRASVFGRDGSRVLGKQLQHVEAAPFHIGQPSSLVRLLTNAQSLQLPRALDLQSDQLRTGHGHAARRAVAPLVQLAETARQLPLRGTLAGKPVGTQRGHQRGPLDRPRQVELRGDHRHLLLIRLILRRGTGGSVVVVGRRSRSKSKSRSRSRQGGGGKGKHRRGAHARSGAHGDRGVGSGRGRRRNRNRRRRRGTEGNDDHLHLHLGFGSRRGRRGRRSRGGRRNDIDTGIFGGGEADGVGLTAAVRGEAELGLRLGHGIGHGIGHGKIAKRGDTFGQVAIAEPVQNGQRRHTRQHQAIGIRA